MESVHTSHSPNVALVEDEALYEVVDGQIVELAPMGANDISLATELVAYLRTFVRQHSLGRVVQEMLFDLGAIVQRKRRTDAAFVSYSRWPQQRRVPRTEAWEVVPNLVVEVVSRNDKGDDIVDKVAEYFRAGVECVWLVFPSQEQIYVYNSPTQVRIFTRTDELPGEPLLPHFRLPLATLFDEGGVSEQP